ncbi:uncharacterized protein LOC119651126 isoform X1 [Hermetia illucens]|uniref:uncharacterized protein LOC119651126 isoform X1 n=1 Tax=Hermetia illucens TaxID=343691 RepID=UPI0018CC0945|nr:uncharacterized protein LOC119651126 isoform X1 [Hermetia illucens]
MTLTDFMIEDTMTVRISLEDDAKTGRTVVALWYFPETTCEPQRNKSFCERKTLPFLLDCDDNTHHKMRGSSTINQTKVLVVRDVHSIEIARYYASSQGKGQKGGFIMLSRRSLVFGKLHGNIYII